MKITKKQWIIGASVAVVLAGGGVGVVANHQAQAQAEKTAQEAKVAHDKLIKAATEATQKAETFKAEADVKSAQDTIKKLDEKDKTALISRVEKVRQNWDLVNKADKAVANAEKTSNDATVKTAQTAIDTLKEDMTKAKKSDLQKRLDKVKTTVKNNKADKAKKEAEAKQKAAAAQTAKSQQTAPTKNTGQDQAAQTSDTVSTTSQGTGSQADNSAAYQPTPQTPTGGGTSNGGASNNNVTPSPTPDPTPAPTPDPTPQPDPTPTPSETFTGWVRNEAGQIVWSQGGFKTLAEAGRAAAIWANDHATGGGWSSGAY